MKIKCLDIWKLLNELNVVGENKLLCGLYPWGHQSKKIEVFFYCIFLYRLHTEFGCVYACFRVVVWLSQENKAYPTLCWFGLWQEIWYDLGIGYSVWMLWLSVTLQAHPMTPRCSGGVIFPDNFTILGLCLLGCQGSGNHFCEKAVVGCKRH